MQKMCCVDLPNWPCFKAEARSFVHKAVEMRMRGIWRRGSLSVVFNALYFCTRGSACPVVQKSPRRW